MDVSVITNWLKLAPSVAWSFVVLIGMMLWGPDWFRSGLGLEAFITEYRNYLGMFFLLSLIGGLTPIWRVVGKKVCEIQFVHFGKKRLKDLTPDEKAILNGFIAQNTKTQKLNTSDGVAMGLAKESIIYQSTRTGHPTPGGAVFGYNIQPWAWKFLRKNPHLLE